MNHDVNINDFDPLTFREDYRESIYNSLIQRLSFMNQMRTEIKKVSLFGGAWISPLFANGFNQDIHEIEDLSSVFMGEALKFDFSFDEEKL